MTVRSLISGDDCVRSAIFAPEESAVSQHSSSPMAEMMNVRDKVNELGISYHRDPVTTRNRVRHHISPPKLEKIFLFCSIRCCTRFLEEGVVWIPDNYHPIAMLSN
jgi:hypothetical protein